MRDAGVPFVMPSAMLEVYVKAYAVFVDAAVWSVVTAPAY